MIVIMDDLPEGGAKRVVYEQVKGLSKLTQVIYISNDLPTIFKFEDYAKVYRFNTDLTVSKGLFRPKQEWSFVTKVIPAYREMCRLVNSTKADVVIVHPSRHTQSPWLLKMLTKPTIYYAEEWPRVVYEPNVHPLPPERLHAAYEAARRWGVKTIDRVSARAATRLVSNSNYMAANLETIYDRKVSVIHPGVDSKIFCPGKVDKTNDYFLFVGEKENISGYHLLSNFKFPLKVVNFKSGGFRYTDQALVDLYRGAIATLCLAENEPFGLTAIESMACGTPVIAVDSGGYKDTVVNKQTGMLIHLNEVGLNQAAVMLTKDKLLRDELGQAGITKVKKDFSWKGHIDKLNRIINEVKSD